MGIVSACALVIVQTNVWNTHQILRLAMSSVSRAILLLSHANKRYVQYRWAVSNYVQSNSKAPKLASKHRSHIRREIWLYLTLLKRFYMFIA